MQTQAAFDVDHDEAPSRTDAQSSANLLEILKIDIVRDLGDLLRTYRPRHVILRSVSMHHRDAESQHYTGVFYVGLGDQFDDDRRLVRATESSLSKDLPSVSAKGPYRVFP